MVDYITPPKDSTWISHESTFFGDFGTLLDSGDVCRLEIRDKPRSVFAVITEETPNMVYLDVYVPVEWNQVKPEVYKMGCSYILSGQPSSRWCIKKDSIEQIEYGERMVWITEQDLVDK